VRRVFGLIMISGLKFFEQLVGVADLKDLRQKHQVR